MPIDFAGFFKLFFQTPQVRILFGLILLDIGLGVAKALKTSTFDFQALAKFYATNILPYIVGYMVLYLAFGFIFPPDYPQLPEVSRDIAWAVLVGALSASIYRNVRALYLDVTTQKNK